MNDAYKPFDVNVKGFAGCSDEELRELFDKINKESLKVAELPVDLFEEYNFSLTAIVAFRRYNRRIKKNYHKILIGYRKILKKYKIKFRKCSRKNIRRK